MGNSCGGRAGRIGDSRGIVSAEGTEGDPARRVRGAGLATFQVIKVGNCVGRSEDPAACIGSFG